MFKYLDFLDNIILESITESIMYITPELRKNLKQINSDISNDLLNVEGKDIEPDVTFIDIDKDGYLSFITMPNARKLIITKWPHLFTSDDISISSDTALAKDMIDAERSGIGAGLLSTSRNLIKIGKLVNKIFPDKYTDKQIEEFVNQFKSIIENNKERFEIVDGDNIDFWYYYTNYLFDFGALGNSCMKNKKGIFEIYNKNPQVCKMLILLEEGKLKGRALVWKIDTVKSDRVPNLKFEYFMDRQYTIDQSDVYKFKKYADDQGWAYKTHNNHDSLGFVTFKGTEYASIKMTVNVNKPINGRYPYMDTFRRFNPTLGILYNDNSLSVAGCYILEDTGGGYTPTM